MSNLTHDVRDRKFRPLGIHGKDNNLKLYLIASFFFLFCKKDKYCNLGRTFLEGFTQAILFEDKMKISL